MTSTITTDTPNPMDEKLSALRDLFPEAFREGKLDTNLLSATLGEHASTEKEAYGMTWAGKSDSRKQILTPTNQTLSGDETASVKWNETSNILIEGENLTVLKLLQKGYTKRFKMIYIDPPYNTGNDFIYSDNFHSDKVEYEEVTGQRNIDGIKMVANTETNGRYHSDWLSMMYPRLHLARNLLRDDGVIFISIGEQEVHNLRKVCDEIFGEENFIGEAGRISKKANNQGDYWSPNFDYVLTYAKSIDHSEPFFGGINYEAYSDVETEGERKGEKYQPIRLYMTSLDPLRGCNNQRYFIKCPDGSYVIPPGDIFPDKLGDGEKIEPKSSKDKVWRWSVGSYLLKKNQLLFKEVKSSNLVDEHGKPAKWNVYTKTFLNDVIEKSSASPNNFIEDHINQTASHELKKLGIPFDFAKPSTLISFFMKTCVSFGNDLILDFFAGSGTTGHAVMALNAEEKAEAVKNGANPDEVGNRRYICVQLPELTDEKSEAFKAGYKKISDITAERLRRAGKKIAEENKDLTLDTGFRLYRLTDSCYKVANVNYDSDNEQFTLESFEKALKSGLSPLREGVSEDDVITENLLKEGFPINSTLTKEKIGNTKFIHAENEGKRLFISFDDSIPLETIDAVQKGYKEAIFIVYDSALTDPLKVMFASRVTLRTI